MLNQHVKSDLSLAKIPSCASPKLHPTEKLDKIPDVLTVKSHLVPPLVLAESYENKGGRNFGEAQPIFVPETWYPALFAAISKLE